MKAIYTLLLGLFSPLKAFMKSFHVPCELQEGLRLITAQVEIQLHQGMVWK